MKNRKFVNSEIEPKNNDLHIINGYSSNGTIIKTKLTNGHQVSTIIHVKKLEIFIHKKNQ